MTDRLIVSYCCDSGEMESSEEGGLGGGSVGEENYFLGYTFTDRSHSSRVVKSIMNLCLEDGLFADVTGLDPLTASHSGLIQCAEQHGAPEGLEKAAAVDYLMATTVEAALPAEQLSVVIDFPCWAAALAQTRPDTDGTDVAVRFEIYYRGLELANGHQELTDADEQRRRFERDNRLRQEHGLNTMDADPYLLDAMHHGLPACSGVAMGVERLLMAQRNSNRIDEVLTFPGDRA